MSKRIFLLRKGFWLLLLKLFVLAFVTTMIFVQLPELLYDFGTKTPLEVSGPEELNNLLPTGSTFAALEGRPDFGRAFVYQRYGLSYTYFVLEPYDPTVIVRTYEEVDENWFEFGNFVGRLRPFDDQPFSYRIEEIMMDQFGETVPENSYFLGLYDVPKVSGWQIGTIALASLLTAAMIYFFFFFKWRKRPDKTDVQIDSLGGQEI